MKRIVAFVGCLATSKTTSGGKIVETMSTKKTKGKDACMNN